MYTRGYLKGISGMGSSSVLSSARSVALLLASCTLPPSHLALPNTC